MRPLPVIAAFITTCAALGAVSWMSRPSTDQLDSGTRREEHPFQEDLDSGGPHPKAVLTEDLHDFGEMVLGATGHHAFVIRNEGDGMLKLKKGFVQCKCTIPTVSEGGIPPGESTEILMEWTPVAETDQFLKSAGIWTNDPENKLLELKIRGAVRKLVEISPGDIWPMGTISEEKPTEFRGAISSDYYESFNILGIESSSEFLTAEFEPLSPEHLEELGARSGYAILGRLEPQMPVGRIEETLKIRTDLEEDMALTVRIEGTRGGPLSILGPGWNAGQMLLRVGDIQAAEGKQTRLSLYVPREEEPLQLVDIHCEPEFLTIELERNDQVDLPAKEWYFLTVSVPPGSPPGYFKESNLASVHLTTNRESFPQIDFNIEFAVH